MTEKKGKENSKAGKIVRGSYDKFKIG